MRRLLLRMTVSLENWDLPKSSCPRGPLFHRWLPAGKADALRFQGKNQGNELLLWFERKGYVDNGWIEYDHKRSEVDESIMRQQGKLDAGTLYGEAAFVNVMEIELDAIKNNNVGSEDYISVGKRVIDFLYPPVSSFVDILRTQYGQYWLPEVLPWDSRKVTLGTYCSSNFSLRWKINDNDEWQRFLPTEQGGFISIGPLPGRGFQEYLTEEDWQQMKSKMDLYEHPLLATMILSKASEFLDTGHLRQAFVEATTAIELAVHHYMKTRADVLGLMSEVFNKFFDLPLAKQVAVICTTSKLVDRDVLEGALQAIEIRNRIVHEGFLPQDDHQKPLRSLFSTVSSLVGVEHKFPVLTGQNEISAFDKDSKKSA